MATTAVAHPNKFAERRAHTRSRLIELGLERFPLRGYSDTTVQHIVSDSGLTRGAFYFHFTNKEEFFVELLRARSGVRGEWWVLARDPARTTLAAMLTAAFAHFAEVGERGSEWVLLIADFSIAIRERPEFAGVMTDLHREFTEELARFVDELAARGLVRTDIAAIELAAEVYAVAGGFQMHTVVYQVPPTSLIDALVRVMRP